MLSTMANITFSCFMLIFIANLGLICGLETPNIDTKDSKVFPAGSDNRSDSEVDWTHRDEMSRMMENHMLRMLKLSSRPRASSADTSVPGYVRALQHAVDDVPPSTVTFDSDDHLMWAVKADKGI